VLTLYGSAKSRASRSILALEELGLPCTHVALGRELRNPASEERKLLNSVNPNGHIPVLDHDGFLIWESMAINLYLAEAFASPLWPADAQSRGRIYLWSFWAQTEMDRKDWELPRRSGDTEAIARVTEAKIATLGILDRALASSPYLLGDAFTLADLNVASTLSQPNEDGRIDWQRLDPAEHNLPRLADWLARCTRRESWQRVAALD
jgi:glutathione S-transferase